MQSDIEKAVKNHDDQVITIKNAERRINEVSMEKKTFMLEIDKIRQELKRYERFINEARGQHDQSIVELKKDVTARLDESAFMIKSFEIERGQLKAQVQNQKYHFTELKKEIGLLYSRVNIVEKTCEEVPGLVEFNEITDCYLQNYLPTEVFTEIHKALYASFENAPTLMRMNQIDYSHERMNDAVEKISRIGSITQETFQKNDFIPLKLDYDAYTIRSKYEEEEKEK